VNITAAIVKNYLTTGFGLLAGLPTIITGSGIVLNPKWQHIMIIVSGVGIVGLGLVAKAFNVHSTSDQVQQATMNATLDNKKPQ
jgi:hypothetical protein